MTQSRENITEIGKYNTILKKYANNKWQLKCYSKLYDVPKPKTKEPKSKIQPNPKNKTFNNIINYVNLQKEKEQVNKKIDYLNFIKSIYTEEELEQQQQELTTEIEIEKIDLGLYSSEKSLRTSISRAKNKLFDYARSNDWELFITLTGDKTKIDRYDLDKMDSYVSDWLNNTRTNYSPDMKYLIVREQHNSEKSECKCLDCSTIYRNIIPQCPKCSSKRKLYAWHYHGLLANTGNLKLTEAYKDGKEWYSTYNDIIDGDVITGKQRVYNLPSYTYGFTTATRIRDSSRASMYISKYMTKENVKYLPKGKKRYFPSRNLDLPDLKYLYLTDDDREKLLKEIDEYKVYEKEIEVRVDCFTSNISLYELDKLNYDIIEDLKPNTEEEYKIDKMVYDDIGKQNPNPLLTFNYSIPSTDIEILKDIKGDTVYSYELKKHINKWDLLNDTRPYIYQQNPITKVWYKDYKTSDIIYKE